MKKLTHSAAARAVAFILCLLCGITALLCAAGYYMTRIDRDRTLPEPDSVSVYQNGIRVLLNNALQEERYTGEYPELPSGYSYVATDRSTGKVLYDGRTKNAVPLGISVGYFSEGVGEGVGIDAQAYLEPKQTPGEELTLLRTSVGTLLRYQNAYLPVGIITAVLCLALLVFLMASMGKKPDGVKLRGIHRVPLDLFLAAALAAVAVPANFYFDLSGINLLYNPLWVWMMPVTLMALWVGFVVLLTLCTISARLRAGKWWRNSIIYIVCRFLYRAVRGFVRALPIAWKGILVYAVVVLVNFFGMLLICLSGSFFQLLVLVALDIAGLYFVIRIIRQLKALQTAAQKLAAGDLTYTVDTEKMYPVLKEHGDDLNAVSVGMSRAVNERMKSERFKTELITNVSHDLKTPLTSIVSYVDLLKKEPIESEQAQEYIEVLDRQSQKLKKLTTDLVDASKASSGALPVNLEKIDLGELLRQSAGEYTEKFAAASITPVLNAPEGETYVTADGRLLWRVLDNLLGNAVKYAQSGTRLYLELTPGETETVLTLKNISREPLNIPAEELMERFVRGDGSRHTDGSGLGLSIANSLMELMGGKLTLTLDGDLFKAALVFPQKTV